MISPKPQAPSADTQGKRMIFMISAGLAAMVLLVFGQTLHNGFINYDDILYVTANPQVTHGFTWAGIKWAFTSVRPAGLWLPLTWLSYMSDSQLYGMNAGGFHFTNTLLHAATAVLLFLLLNQMTGTLWRSAFAAAIFAVHPLRVESVAWVAERKDTLSGFFFMLTLLMYVQYVRGGARCWSRPYLLMIIFALMGLMAKPMLVTLPCVLLLLDYWPLQRFTFQSSPGVFRPLLVEKLPLFVLAAAASVLAFSSQKSGNAMFPAPFGLRLENTLVSHGIYFIKMFWPEHLAVLYPYPLHIPRWDVVAGAALLLGGTLAVIMLRRRFPWLLFGWFWHVCMLAPVIGIVQVGGQAMADRFTYLPQIGLCVALAWGINAFATAWRVPRIALGMLAGITITVLMACSIHQISYWRDSESLWMHTLACTPPNSIAQFELGLALDVDGRRGEAIEHYRQALKIDPDYSSALTCLGHALFEEGRFDEAVDCMNRAIQVQPGDFQDYNILGTALAKEGKAVEAINAYRKALELQPDNPEVCFHLAELLAAQGQFEEAITQYQEVVRLKPDYVTAHYHLAVLLASHSRLDAAAQEFQTVIQLDPNYTNAYGNLANVLMGQGKLDEAITQYQQTVEMAPGSAQAHFRLGEALEKKGRTADAIEQFRDTLQLNPNHQDAKNHLRNLGALPQ